MWRCSPTSHKYTSQRCFLRIAIERAPNRHGVLTGLDQPTKQAVNGHKMY